jgi:hypothetical protein
MAVTIILPPAEILSATVAELRTAAQNDAKRLAVLNRATYDLLVLQPRIVRISGAYLMPSTSRGGIVHRIDDVNGCDCETGRKGCQCRHVVALELIEQANMHTMPSLPTRQYTDAEYANALAAMDELFA